MPGDVAHWRALVHLDAGQLRAQIARARNGDPARLLLEVVRIARAAQLASQFEVRDEALRVAADVDATDVDVLVEQAIDAARDGEPDRADALAEQVVSHVLVTDRLRARALLARGSAAAWRGGSVGKMQADGLLGEAAELLVDAGEVEWAAGAMVSRAIQVSYLNGDLSAAVDQVERALALQPEPSRFRGITLAFWADTLAMVGRSDDADAAAEEAAAIGRRLGDHRVLAYAAWGAAYAAAVRRNRVVLLESLHEVERHPGDWNAGPGGAEFLASAADLLGRIGAPEAEQALARAEAAADECGYPEIAAMARAAHEARTGDPAGARELLAQLPDSDEVPPREHWRVLLLTAYAASRAGDTDATKEFSDRARAAARRLGLAQLPELHEPLVAAALGTASEPAEPHRPLVSVLGGFAVAIDGRPADVEPGQVSVLVAYLAVTGGERTVEEVIEAIWPDDDPSATRVRLRNLLYRLRREAGELIVRRGDSLRLDADTDLARFETAARAALSATGARQDEAVDVALHAYRGDLLPADRYAEWAASPRERTRLLHLSVVDLAVRSRERTGRFDEALGLLELAIATEPLDEARYRTAARIARAQGNEATARRYDERAAEVRRELGL